MASLSPGQLDPGDTRQVRLRSARYPLRKALLQRTECSGAFLNFLSPFLCRRLRDFPPHSLWDLVELLEVHLKKCGVLHDWVPLERLALRVTPRPPGMHWLQLGFPGHGGVCPWVLPPTSCGPLYSASAGLPCVIPSLTDPRRAVDFSFCSVIYFLLRRCGKFEAELELKFLSRLFAKIKLALP